MEHGPGCAAQTCAIRCYDAPVVRQPSSPHIPLFTYRFSNCDNAGHESGMILETSSAGHLVFSARGCQSAATSMVLFSENDKRGTLTLMQRPVMWHPPPQSVSEYHASTHAQPPAHSSRHCETSAPSRLAHGRAHDSRHQAAVGRRSWQP